MDDNATTTSPTPKSPRRSRSPGLFLPLSFLCAIAIYVVAQLLLRMAVPHPELEAAQSRDKLERIGLALRSYHDTYDSLPPAYVSDASGKRLYSWRVLLLPFLGEEKLFAAFDKSKAWDSPENVALSERLPDIFALPGNTSHGCGYFAVTGSGTAFERDTAVHLHEISDGSSLTIGMVEIRGLTCSWAEPFDLDLDQCPRVMGNQPGQLPGPGEHVSFQAVMFDGSVPAFTYPPELCFRAMATIAGNERLDNIEARMLGQIPRQPRITPGWAFQEAPK